MFTILDKPAVPMDVVFRNGFATANTIEVSILIKAKPVLSHLPPSLYFSFSSIVPSFELISFFLLSQQESSLSLLLSDNFVDRKAIAQKSWWYDWGNTFCGWYEVMPTIEMDNTLSK